MGAWKKRGTNLEVGDDNYGCLRKFNYSNGAGWKTSKKWEKKISFAGKRKKKGGSY